MSTDRRTTDSTAPGQTILTELQTLLGSLLGLYAQVSSRLLNSRMRTKQESAASREGIPVEKLLARHIDETAAAFAQAQRASDGEKPAASPRTSRTRPTVSADKAGARRPAAGLLGALSQYFDRHPSSPHCEPLVREKMRSRTLDHINKALVLARQGDAERAKIHAGLAESAMRTAAEYMSDEEYREFTAQVQSRLHSAGPPR
jgi:hypothetical protein